MLRNVGYGVLVGAAVGGVVGYAGHIVKTSDYTKKRRTILNSHPWLEHDRSLLNLVTPHANTKGTTFFISLIKECIAEKDDFKVNKHCSALKNEYKKLLQETIKSDPHTVVEDESAILETWCDERIRLAVLNQKDSKK